MTPALALPVAAAQPPLRRTELLEFNPDGMTVALQEGVLEHVQLERGAFRGRIAHKPAPHSRVDWGRYALAVLARGDLNRGMVTITIALTGRGQWRVHGRSAEHGEIVVFPERGELLAALPLQAEWWSLQLPRERMEAAGLALGRCLEQGARRTQGELGAGLQRTLVDLAPVLAPHHDSPDFVDSAVALAHEELTAAVSAELALRGGDVGAPRMPGERWRVIQRAERYLEERDDPTVRIDDLCIAACTSLSRMERAFRETFGLSPRRCLMLRRLAAVRRELLRTGTGASVTEVATHWGFFHLGRFPQACRQHFLELPSQTARGARP